MFSDPLCIPSKKIINLVGTKNINAIKNEFDLHIPLDYFNNNLENSVYLIAYEHNYNYNYNHDHNHNYEHSYTLVIAGSLKIYSDVQIKDIFYQRKLNNFNVDNFTKGLPFQLLFEKWEVTNEQISLKTSDVKYISVMRKIKNNELFNVFSPMTLNKHDNLYLFHNTVHPINESNINHILTYPSFSIQFHKHLKQCRRIIS